ncbi:hypothetical protein J2128_002507 [Methanomicrobium sp. W14]|uniref:hypothetical protein n=1 Tax=Methanomicrobium sp. W14 TaxID=2817839 RepID=UPI001AE535E2|nr:hypothetical protein [Methanomicrobium sp. W14]MBP2134536.1 hypothetical protein [Methanomicrobium sp. W14]
MKRKSIIGICFFLAGFCNIICGIPVSADDKIILFRPIPDELLQKETPDIFLKSSYHESEVKIPLRGAGNNFVRTVPELSGGL